MTTNKTPTHNGIPKAIPIGESLPLALSAISLDAKIINPGKPKIKPINFFMLFILFLFTYSFVFSIPVLLYSQIARLFRLHLYFYV